MKVIIKSVVELDDNFWGFTDLIDGRDISYEVMEEIKDLIQEDSSALNNRDNWSIEIITTNLKR